MSADANFLADLDRRTLPQSPEGSRSTDQDATFLADLYRRTLLAPNDAALLEELRGAAARIVPSLANEELEQILAVDGLDQVAGEWLASVYEVLAAADPCPGLPEDARAAILRATEQEERAIGQAFKFVLLARLSPRLTNLTVVFAAAPHIAEKAQRNLRRTPSVKEAWPECAPLAACGLTPLGVFYATEAVVRLALRLHEAEVLPRSAPLVLTPRKARPRSRTPRDFVDYLPGEFMRVAHCGEETAECLLDWLIGVALEKPRVFKGAFAEPLAEAVDLRFDETQMTLLQRWNTLRGEDALAPDSGVDSHRSWSHA